MSVHIGTSGWSYKDWKGIFYPVNVAPAGFLGFYAEHFMATEINSSFYRLPQKKTVEKWMKSVPQDFYFCPKMSRYLTHLKKLHDFEEPLGRFFECFDVMHPKMGPVLFQLPASLAFAMPVVLPLYECLKRKYADYRFAVEARHNSWFTKEAVSLAEKYGIALVVAQSDRFPYHEMITSKDIYIRLHGPGKLYGSSYSDESLKIYARKIHTWNRHGHNIWAFFNNDMNGHAVANARTLLGMI